MTLTDIQKLTTLVKRLEAVASRLEDIFDSPEYAGIVTNNTESKANLLNAIHSSLTATPRLPDSQVDHVRFEEHLPDSILAFDDFLETSVGKYVRLSNELGGLVARQAQVVLACFHEQRKFLLTASKTPKPDAAGLKTRMQPTNDVATQVVAIQGVARHDLLYNHLSCVADGMPVLGWVTIEMNAFRHVEKFLDQGQYFGNKVMVEYKEKDPKHVEWVQSYYQIFRDLSSLIKDHFRTGTGWYVDSNRSV